MYELKLLWQNLTLIILTLMARRQSIAASVQKLPNSVVKSVSRACHTVYMSGKMISLSLTFDLLHITYIKDKQMLVFNFISDLVWRGRGSQQVL
jgi:hypothetical protein